MKSGRSILLLSLLLFSNRLRADIVINEIMYNSVGPTETNREYVELYNTGTSSVDLTGWKLHESTSTSQVYNSSSAFVTGTVIQSGGYLIVTNAGSASEFQSAYPSTPTDVPIVLFEMSLINSPNSGAAWPTEQIIIANSSGQTVDQVTYDDAGVWVNVADGYSLELVSATSDNSQGGNWKESLVAGGTPGQVNSVTPEPSSAVLFGGALLYFIGKGRRRSRRSRGEHVAVTGRIPSESVSQKPSFGPVGTG